MSGLAAEKVLSRATGRYGKLPGRHNDYPNFAKLLTGEYSE
jgi:hypothetical protein